MFPKFERTQLAHVLESVCLCFHWTMLCIIWVYHINCLIQCRYCRMNIYQISVSNHSRMIGSMVMPFLNLLHYHCSTQLQTSAVRKEKVRRTNWAWTDKNQPIWVNSWFAHGHVVMCYSLPWVILEFTLLYIRASYYHTDRAISITINRSKHQTTIYKRKHHKTWRQSCKLL